MSVVTATILSEGQEMDPAFELVSVDVSKEVNRLPDARIVLLDGGAARRSFPISDTAFFEPGKEIEIRLRYEGGSEATVFQGVAIRHGIQASEDGAFLSVEMKDTAVKLTHPRRSVVYRDLSDADIFSRLIREAGLEEGEIAPTEPVNPEIVQYGCSDWDFMLSRAEILGLLVVVDDGRVSLRPIELTGSPLHRFEFGLSELLDFEFEADVLYQAPDIQSVGWDSAGLTATQPKRAEDFSLAQGNLDAAGIASKLGFATCTLSHPVPLAPQELQNWANARLARNRMAMIRGRLSLPGTANVKLFDLIELAGVGDRFTGKTLVTGIRHRFGDQGWRTDLQIGLAPQWFSRRPDIQDVPAAGLLPAASSLQIGVVDQFEQDPDDQLRVRVRLPAIGEAEGSVWARLASPEAGAGRGYFFRPEPGDEVIVGFFNNDPRQAVILGALFGATNAPPEDLAVSEENTAKAIVTKRGTTIGFVDADKASVYIQTADHNKILLDDDTKGITISDQHGSSITLGESGIEIKSGKDLRIEASGNVQIKGQAVDVK